MATIPTIPVDRAFVAHCEAYFAELDAADEADRIAADVCAFDQPIQADLRYGERKGWYSRSDLS